MPSQFQDIKEVFDANHLRLPELNILVPDTNLYEIIAIQPTGAIAVHPDFVGHADQASAIDKFNSFLELAVEQNCDLAITPEYSCPWEVVTRAIAENKLPAQRKLWILACEAITPQQLRGIIAAHSNVIWIHEPIPAGAGQFLGVLAYVTKAEADTGGVKDVIVLQFKTEPMGGYAFERDHLLRGQTIYSWRNPQENIRLVSLLCSDALAFEGGNNNQCRFDLHPHLIFHPQLNLDPRHAGFSGYRDQLFNREISKHVEVLTLNWARGFSIPSLPDSAYGGSTVYTKSEGFDISDARIVANHERGFYFCYWHEHRTQLCLFDYDEHVFHFRMPKVLQDAAAVVARRTGPEMLALRNWNSVTKTWPEGVQVNDGYDTLCSEFNEQHCDYCATAPHNVVDRERLLMLATGNLPNLSPDSDWHQLLNLDSFRAERDERSKRLTFTHEQALNSVSYRNEHMGRFIALQMVILANPANFPPTLHDLRNDWQVRPPQHDDRFRFNLVSRSGQKQGATVIFAGLVPFSQVTRLRDRIVRAWTKAETRRLVIWYQVQGDYLHLEPPTPAIDDDAELPDSYARSSSHE